MNKIVYLDHNATTQLDFRVLDSMLPFFNEKFGNASSLDHSYGHDASTAVESARADIAKVIGSKHDEIVFTSGATESNNLAIIGVMKKHKQKGDHLITCVTEHESVLNTVKHMEKIGKNVTYLPVNELGHIDLDDLRDAINDKTVLISIMTANNEIGTIHNISSIGKIAHEHDVLFHTDAAQAVGHIPIDVNKMNIDLMSFSAHKMYGPKGIGALYVRGISPRFKLDEILHGGGQERGVRSGTLNVPGIVGFGKATTLASKEMDSEGYRLKKLATNMYRIFCDCGGMLNGDSVHRLSGNLNMYFPKIEAKAIINLVSEQIAISSGSACTTRSIEPSHVILALGYNDERAHSSIRVGLGRYTKSDQVEFAAQEIVNAVRNLASIK